MILSRRLPSAVLAAAAFVTASGAPAVAGGLASLCAEYETRTVSGIIEDLLTDVDDCVRVAAAPADSPRPSPRPVLLAAPVNPFALPETKIVSAAMGAPILVGGPTPPRLFPKPARPSIDLPSLGGGLGPIFVSGRDPDPREPDEPVATGPEPSPPETRDPDGPEEEGPRNERPDPGGKTPTDPDPGPGPGPDPNPDPVPTDEPPAVTPVPLPAGMWFLALGVAGLAGAGAARRRDAAEGARGA